MKSYEIKSEDRRNSGVVIKVELRNGSELTYELKQEDVLYYKRKNDDTLYEAVISFGSYLDNEGYADNLHLGWFISQDTGNSFAETTLLDIICDFISEEIILYKIKSGERIMVVKE